MMSLEKESLNYPPIMISKQIPQSDYQSPWINKKSTKKRRLLHISKAHKLERVKNSIPHILVLCFSSAECENEVGRWYIPVRTLSDEQTIFLNQVHMADYDDNDERFLALSLQWRLEDKGELGEIKDRVAENGGKDFAERILPAEAEGIWSNHYVDENHIPPVNWSIKKTVITTLNIFNRV